MVEARGTIRQRENRESAACIGDEGQAQRCCAQKKLKPSIQWLKLAAAVESSEPGDVAA